MNRFKIIFFYFLQGALLAGCLSGCLPHHLEVQTQYLGREHLASYHVYTPDPHLDHPAIGQRLLIQWSLPSAVLNGEELELFVKMRFRNHQEKEMTKKICNKRGTYYFDLVDEAYCKSGGILTYKVEVHQGDCLLELWQHPLWTDLITFDFSDTAPAHE